ncbi:sigma-54 interaction domain-containing protein [Aneurinibacillus tyrosinisolvens]|uniref:sigma-54 interaction domain-containing protein n=1 Tax=Aneurinibacillus tyrosinisolvens TaxID=1443435 RepID=UPI0009E324E1|nr:sigma 54-interacting transcriptional regulator [Aneurinibacillus tyrosinisolvens]
MIALYKISQPLDDQMEKLLQEMGYQTARFYSIKSLMNQVMNTRVILALDIYKKEVEALPVPVIPLSIHLIDIIKTIEERDLLSRSRDSLWFVGSEEEVEWLKWEYKQNPQISLCFVSKEQFLDRDMEQERVYLVPFWEKELYSDPIIQASIYYVMPSIISLLPVLRLVTSLVHFADEVTRERFQVEAIVNSAHDGVIAVDREGSITVVNQHAKTILGLQEDVKGRKITEFIPQSDMMRVLQTGKIETGDIATVMDRQIVINRFPVIVMNHVVGAVSNFKVITDIQKMELKLRKMLHQNGLEAKYMLKDIVGESSLIVAAKELASRFAETEASVLITGESGTGKELFAQGIHLANQRALGPFLAVNCAALPESLLESELFGYEEGAFTGARKGGKTGLFELAHGGTLFLDEIGEMPLRIQSLLLRVLQEKTVRRVGGERIIPVDVRIIAATNRDLEEEIDAKQFRVDLYYRLNVLTLELPPLRQRLADIPAVVESVVQQLNEKRKTKIIKIDEELYEIFTGYNWPGNIRELRNVVERMVVLEQGQTLSVKGAAFFSQKIKENKSKIENLSLSIKDKEREAIVTALTKYANNKTLAAKSLGVDRSTLWRKIKEYNL